MSAYGDEEKERHEFVRTLIQQLAPSPAEMVELGAAPGDQAIVFARLGYAVTAVDLGEASGRSRVRRRPARWERESPKPGSTC